MTPAAPRVSVVVPTYQRRESVRRLLEALRSQTLSADAFEVIVVIDGSDDGTRELVDRFDAPYRLVAIWKPNGGRASACNAGIRAAAGEFIVLLDDDMEPSPELLSGHLVAHEAGDRLGVLGAVPIPVDESSPPVVRFIGEKFNRHLERLASGGEIRFKSFYSGNFSIRRTLLVEAGMFDERYRVYGNEDTELAMRLADIGVELRYEPRALAVQHYEKDFAGLARDNLGKGRTAVVTARKHAERLGLDSFDERAFRLQSERWTDRSPKWKILRSTLLLASRYSDAPSRGLIRLVQWLEKREPKKLTIAYLFALDFFYWRGVALESAQPLVAEDGPSPARNGAPGAAPLPAGISGAHVEPPEASRRAEGAESPLQPTTTSAAALTAVPGPAGNGVPR